jgi:hypothetical protein
MQESRAQRDISVSKQRLTQSRSVGPSISDAVGAHRFPTDWRLTVRRVGREKRGSLMRSRDGAVGSLWSWAAVRHHAHTLPQYLSKRSLGGRGLVVSSKRRHSYSGSPAFRRPSSNLARSSGRRSGTQSLTLTTRIAGSSWRRRAIVCCASEIRPASA